MVPPALVSVNLASTLLAMAHALVALQARFHLATRVPRVSAARTASSLVAMEVISVRLVCLALMALLTRVFSVV